MAVENESVAQAVQLMFVLAFFPLCFTWGFWYHFGGIGTTWILHHSLVLVSSTSTQDIALRSPWSSFDFLEGTFLKDNFFVVELLIKGIKICGVAWNISFVYDPTLFTFGLSLEGEKAA